MVLKNKIYLFEFFIGIIILLTMILINNTSYYNLIITLSFIIITIIMYKSLGMQFTNKRIKKIITEITIVLILLFIIISFISGLVVGFVKNPIVVNLESIIKNTYSVTILIACEEIIRFIVARKCIGKDFLPLIIITILFMVLDIVFLTINYNSIYTYSFFVTLTTLIIPSIARNIISSYLSYYVGYLPCILLRGFFGVYPYIFSIYPNYGDYITSIVNLLVPVILFISTNKHINNYEKTKKIERISKKTWYLIIPLWGLIIIMIILISGFFKYQIMAVGSGSMRPSISYGDAVVFEKIKDYKKIKKDDVIVFGADNKSIVHRVINIEYNDSDVLVHTKGDANNHADIYNLTSKDIKGIVRLNIKYIGLPTVKLMEFFGK